MVFFTSNLFFGNKDIAKQRHFNSTVEMDNCLVSNWNKVVADSDTVYILGGIGDWSLLQSLYGKIKVVMSDSEDEFYQEYVKGISNIRDDVIDFEIFKFDMQTKYNIEVCNSRRIMIKDYQGDFLRIQTNPKCIPNDNVFNVVGNIGNMQKVFNKGINADITVNGMYPVSDYTVLQYKKQLSNLL